MSDAAAFFAKKKKGGKKKKAFKAFNANKIDATAVASTVHVDAPAISNSSFETSVSPNLSSSGPSTSDAPKLVDEDWATPEQKAPPTTNVVHPKRGTVTELLDMNALEARRREEDDVVERLRVEETKAALTSARVGMKKEAQRLKEKEEAKKQKETSAKAAQTVGSADGRSSKWLPPHQRGGASAALGNSRLMMSRARGGGGSAGIDTKDDNDFPDLASANAAIEEQKRLEKEQSEKERLRIANKKASATTPWGAGKPRGANSAVRQPLKIAPPKKVTEAKGAAPTAEPSTEVSEVVDAPVVSPSPLPNKPQPSATTTAPAKEAPAPPARVSVTSVEKTTVKKKKKKKKDLSTFQPSS